MKLSPQQSGAAHRIDQDVCVVAGPGSGKTRVLTERFCWLIREQQVAPERILAITFTEKASTEIKNRLVSEFGSESELHQRVERAWVSTIHGFCTRLLREHAVSAGVDIDFGVLDESQASEALRLSAVEALDGLLEDRPSETRSLLTSLHVSSSPWGRRPDLPTALISIYEATRVAGESPVTLRRSASSGGGATLRNLADFVSPLIGNMWDWDTAARRDKQAQLAAWTQSAYALTGGEVSEEHFRVLEEFRPNLQGVKKPIADQLRHARDTLAKQVLANMVERHYQGSRELLIEALICLDTLYRQRKDSLAALDFSDLEERTLGLLESDKGVLEAVRRRFDHILMDELQDTNPLQWKIVDKLRRPDRFFGVGDVNQSIYGFRHADPRAYSQYRRSLEAQGKVVDHLTENYRSRAEILATVDTLLADASGLELEELEAKREFVDKPGPPVEVHVATADSREQAEVEEADWIARRIVAISASTGRPLREIAVLARKGNALKPIERALKQLRVPCLVVAGRTLLESREVRDLTLLLGSIASSEDEVSLAGLLRSPLVGLSEDALFRLQLRGGLWREPDSMMDPADRDRLEWCRELLEELRRNRDAISPDRLLTRFLDESGYEDGLEDHQRANIEKFLVSLRELWRQKPRPAAELLLDVHRLRAAETEAEAPPASTANAVQLMTIHAAKGLEFPIVFLAALHQSPPSDIDPICYSAENGFGVCWRDPVSGGRAADSVWTVVEQQEKRRQAAEEVRLLYVAMTRSEDHLVLSYAATDRGKGSSWSRLIEQRLALTAAGDSEPAAAAPIRPSTDAAENVELLDRPTVSAQHDSSAAVTHIGEYAACPRKYYLSSYLGFEAPMRSTLADPLEAELSGSELGTEVHQLLAGAEVENPSADALELVKTFQASELAARIERATRVEREFAFRMEIEDLVLRGQIDLWFEEAGELVLVDYKTDRDESHINSYLLQLHLYALALEKSTGKVPDRAVLYFLRSNKEVPVELARLDNARERVCRFRDAQHTLRFPLAEGEHCYQCEFFRSLCPVGRDPGRAARRLASLHT